MKQYKTVTKTSEYLEHIICDVCGDKTDRYSSGNWPGSADPSCDYSKAAVEVVLTDGMYYPEFFCYTKTSVDMCPKCFKEKLVPFLVSIGANVTEEEISD